MAALRLPVQRTVLVAKVDAVAEYGRRHLVAILTRERLINVLSYLLDENEFLSPYGIRSLYEVHEAQPYSLSFNGVTFTINYQSAESQSGLFGGNSNWRGRSGFR